MMRRRGGILLRKLQASQPEAIWRVSGMKRFIFGTVLAAAMPAALSAEVLPLQDGNYWLYRDSKNGGEFEVSVSTPYLIDGKVYWSLKGYVKQRAFGPMAHRILVRNGESGNLYFYNEETEREELLTSFETVDGAWANAPLRECDQESQRQAKPVRYEGGAGVHDKAVQLNYRSFGCADAGIASELYLENIGMLRRSITTIAGPRDFDLVHARVGKTVLSALPSASLEVSAASLEGRDDLEVTLRYLSNVLEPRQLFFATAQEFDFAIKNLDGSEVYRYSNDQQFGPEEHERTIFNGWTWRVRVPKVAAGNYTLEAWITTKDRPVFAGSVKLLVP